MNQYHIKLHAYVGSGDHDPTPVWGKATFTTFGVVYRGRPMASRFAVVEDTTEGDFLVIDLFEVQLNKDLATFTIPPAALSVFPTLDAAIMSATINL